MERRIEAALQAALGYEVTTFILSPSELAQVAAYRPFKDADLDAAGNALYIAFLADRPADAAQRKLLSFASAVDSFHVAGREAYWLCRKKFSESEFSGAKLEKTLGMPSTVRNVTTIRKIAAKFA